MSRKRSIIYKRSAHRQFITSLTDEISTTNAMAAKLQAAVSGAELVLFDMLFRIKT